jgi:hypothetical protein
MLLRGHLLCLSLPPFLRFLRRRGRTLHSEQYLLCHLALSLRPGAD